MIADPGDERITEELTLVSGDMEVVLEVASGLLQGEGLGVKADSDALAEGLVGCEATLLGQVRLVENGPTRINQCGL